MKAKKVAGLILIIIGGLILLGGLVQLSVYYGESISCVDSPPQTSGNGALGPLYSCKEWAQMMLPYSSIPIIVGAGLLAGGFVILRKFGSVPSSILTEQESHSRLKTNDGTSSVQTAKFCTSCGQELRQKAAFCSKCGSSQS